MDLNTIHMFMIIRIIFSLIPKSALPITKITTRLISPILLQAKNPTGMILKQVSASNQRLKLLHDVEMGVEKKSRELFLWHYPLLYVLPQPACAYRQDK